MTRTLVQGMLGLLACCLVVSAAKADPIPIVRGAAEVEPGALSIVYNPETGNVNVFAPDGEPFTAIELRSSNLFLPAGCQNLGGAFDVCAGNKLFKLNADGFPSAVLGSVLPPGLTAEELLADISVDGATVGGDFLVGDGPILVHPSIAIPEPTTAILALIGLAVLPTLRRR